MKTEKAIERIKAFRDYLCAGNPIWDVGECKEAFDIVIAAMEQRWLPAADVPDINDGDIISRQAAIRWIKAECNPYGKPTLDFESGKKVIEHLKQMPSAQPKKEIAKRVLWTGWKGCRNTRYKCPNCKKPVKNDDIYCHRCGQKLMFPHISFTDYVPGEKQETIVRWDDE